MQRGVIALVCLLAALVPAAQAGAQPLRTAVLDPTHFAGPNSELAFKRTKAAGATMVRLVLPWSAVAPSVRPAGFNPEDPDDPAYSWRFMDRHIAEAREAGLEPIVAITTAPEWASDSGKGSPGTINVNAVEYGRFAFAAATRYSGNHADPDGEPTWAPTLPRVRYWQAWNEPNRDYFFQPQYQGKRMVSPGLYRNLVNRFAAAVHSVDRANMVIAGGLAPLGRPGKPAPLSFMRAFLAAKVEFDIWSHHPYTSGSPTHRASGKNDVSLGDLPEMRSVLRTAVRNGRVRAARSPQFWVTEFSWDTKPPDPKALPTVLHQRWVSEALYRMWRNGVSVVTWFRIQDDPLSVSPYQSGFYRSDGRRKSSLTAFRFPVVAFKQKRGVYVWGRTPTSARGTVVVELKAGRSWRRLGTLRSNSYGIFQKIYKTPYRKGHVRARYKAERSLGFSLTPVRDRYVNPFGCGGVVRC